MTTEAGVAAGVPDGGEPGVPARRYGGPRLPADLVPRPRLTQQLDVRAPLTLLRAPLGFGKTTLVAQWATAADDSSETLAWLHVDEDTGTADTVWRTLLQVLVSVGLPVPQGNEDSPTARGLVAEALRSAGPIVLVVDNFERVADDGIDHALLDLVRRIPLLRLIVCLRGHRHFRAHDRLDIDIVELTAHELLFTIHETSTLLTAAELGVDHEIAETIHADVGGWPEPTRAIAAALRYRQLATETAHQLATREATEFLRHRLVPEERSDRVHFALATSIPETFTAEIAHLLTDDEDANSLLGLLEADGILAGTSEDGELVYRWPPAARRALARELKRRAPEQIPLLHSRLAEWYHAHDQPAQALQHAVDAEAWSLVVRIIDTSWRELWANHRELLRRAQVATPLEVIATSPRALAVRDWRLRWPDDRVLDLAPLPDHSGARAALGRSQRAPEVLETGIAMMATLRRRGHLARAHDYARRLTDVATAATGAQSAEVSTILSSLYLHIGVTALMANDLDGGVQPLRQAYEHRERASSIYIGRDAAGKLALLYAVSGDPNLAQHWLHRYEAAPTQSGHIAELVRVTGDTARMLLAIDRLDLDEAAHLNRPLTDTANDDEFWTYILYAQAQLALHAQNAPHLLSQIDVARSIHRQWLGDAVSTPLLASAEVDLLLALGRGNEARAAIRGTAADHGLLRVAQARLALLAGNPEAALRRAIDNSWARTTTSRLRQEMLLIQAIAADRIGDRETARTAIQQVMRAAWVTGSVRALTTVPREEVAQLAAYTPEISDLLATPPLNTATELFPRTITLVDLTNREQLVLEKLDEGLTIPQIAAALYVTRNTIKSQLRGLYQKLGVDSRHDAIARGHQWGLLTTSPVTASPEGNNTSRSSNH